MKAYEIKVVKIKNALLFPHIVALLIILVISTNNLNCKTVNNFSE